jgi:hypothetical protein
MPYKDKSDRNYKREYENYDGTEAVKKRRAKRNAARNKLLKAGVVHKGDGKDVDHIKPLSKGGSNGRGNLRAVSANANRSFPRNKDRSIK